MCRVNSIKLVGLVTVALAFTFLYGCSNSADKGPSEKKASPSTETSPKEQKAAELEIPKPTDIEVRINTKPVGVRLFDSGSGEGVFSEISYEGKVTNTGFQIVAITEVNLSWNDEWIGRHGQTIKYRASKVEIFKNLRPGETREFSEAMVVMPGNEVTKKHMLLEGGAYLSRFKKGVGNYDVNVYHKK